MGGLSLPDAPAAFTAHSERLCAALGLAALGPVLHLALVSCAACFALQQLSRSVCPWLFPAVYPVSHKKRTDWDLHVVGWAFALCASPLALWHILERSPELQDDPVYGLARSEAQLAALSTGYFIWDGIVSTRNIGSQGLGFVLHGVGCAIAFAGTLRPFMLFQAPNFLIWESSSIFLNFHWYLDKFGKTGSTLQLVNGLLLLGTYVVARLCWGTYQSYKTWQILFASKHAHRVGKFKYLYAALNILMNSLNWIWFRAMIRALRKRFQKPARDASGAAAAGKKKS